VVIETTGLADPAPVVQTFFTDRKIQRRYYPDAVITVVDSKHIEQHLDDGHEAVEQIAFADLVLLNNTDLVPSDHLSQLEDRIKRTNATAHVLRTELSRVPIQELLDIRAFDLSQKLEVDPGFLEEEDHEHDQSVTSMGLREEVPLERMRFQYWLQNLLNTKGQDIFRFKGVLDVKGMAQRVVAQGVHMIFSQAVDRPWENDEPRISEMVFIGRNLDAEELRSGLSGCRIRSEVKQLKSRPCPGGQRVPEGEPIDGAGKGARRRVVGAQGFRALRRSGHQGATGEGMEFLAEAVVSDVTEGWVRNGRPRTRLYVNCLPSRRA
jgi:G3E family GTPase